jgi:hypothetical protein
LPDHEVFICRTGINSAAESEDFPAFAPSGQPLDAS